jgi:ABC-type transport system involved in multi-copper enzyme maturation permease subunit
MAVHNVGYRSWSGRLAPSWSRWTTIASVGVRCAWQSRWLRRLLLLAWLPSIWFALGFFMWEQAQQYSDWKFAFSAFAGDLPQGQAIKNLLRTDDVAALAEARHTVWAWLLYTFFRYPQALIMVLVVGIIAPPLISQDLRSRAYLLYFSRPLSRSEYILGKTVSVWVFLVAISALPALILYVLGILLSPNLEVIGATWDLPLRIVAATAVLMVPMATLALCMSSMTQESRYAAFAWFSLWVLGWFAYGVMTSIDMFHALEPSEVKGTVPVVTNDWSYLSLYHTLGKVEGWVFGFSDFESVRLSLTILVVITLFSLGILMQRVAAPMKA